MTKFGYAKNHPIPSSDKILRRLPPTQIVPDGNEGFRASSAGFNASTKERSNGERLGMSVDWKELIIQDAIDPVLRHSSSEYGHEFLGEVPVSVVSEQDLATEYDPIPSNAYHTQVWLSDGKTKLTDKQRSALSRACKLIFDPKA